LARRLIVELLDASQVWLGELPEVVVGAELGLELPEARQLPTMTATIIRPRMGGHVGEVLL
jgi:hypothetical protein